MKTIKMLLVTPKHIACQIFYALLLTLIVCLLSGQEIMNMLFIKAEIVTIINMPVVYFLMKIVFKSVDSGSGGIISPAVSAFGDIVFMLLGGCFMLATAFFFFGINLQNFHVLVLLPNVWIIGVLVPMGIMFILVSAPLIKIIFKEGISFH